MSASTKYCAFLRGVNVGKIKLQMSDVKRIFTEVGCTNVQSILATGNIIFESDKPQKELKIQLETALSSAFHYEAFIFLKTAEQVRKMLQNCPFEALPEQHVYIFVGEDGLANTLNARFVEVDKHIGEKGLVVDGVFYWTIAKGATLESMFGKVIGDKKLKNQLTSRNKNTFDKIIQKLYL